MLTYKPEIYQHMFNSFEQKKYFENTYAALKTVYFSFYVSKIDM